MKNSVRITLGLGAFVVGFTVWKFRPQAAQAPAPVPTGPREMIVAFAGCKMDADTFGNVSYATEGLMKVLKKYEIPSTFDKTEGLCEIQFVSGTNKMSITRFGTDSDMFQTAVTFFQLDPGIAAAE